MSDHYLFCAHMSCIQVLFHIPFFSFLSHVTDNILAYKCMVCATIYLSNSCLPIPACLSYPFRCPLLSAQQHQVLLLKSRGAFPRHLTFPTPLFLALCLAMSRSGSEPWFGPDLDRTGPILGFRFGLCPGPDRWSGSRFVGPQRFAERVLNRSEP